MDQLYRDSEKILNKYVHQYIYTLILLVKIEDNVGSISIQKTYSILFNLQIQIVRETPPSSGKYCNMKMSIVAHSCF